MSNSSKAWDLSPTRLRAFVVEVLDTLYPGGDPDAPWSADTLETIGLITRNYGLAPESRSEVAASKGGWGYRYAQADGTPLTRCPLCDQDLAADGGICLTLASNSGDRTWSEFTRLDEQGCLIDTCNGDVEAGRHSLTECGQCFERLTSFEKAV